MEKFIESYLSNYKNYKDYWNYEDGCVLTGAKQMYEATGDEKYVTFIERYLDKWIGEDGTITGYEAGKCNIDSINSGKVLFFMYEKTGEEKYREALEFIMEQLRVHPRCGCGNFWHKKIYPDQIWLDGLYMAQPFYMEYETKFNGKSNYADIMSQFENVQRYLFDEEKRLCYHAYDEKKEAFWCDKESGRSANFWLRSMGWYLMALIDVMDVMSIEIYEYYRGLQNIFKTLIKGIMKYQDSETKMFYQVIDKGYDPDNYLETSGSAMIAYAIIKACRMKVLQSEKYLQCGLDILEGIITNQVKERGGEIHLDGICHMAGLGPEERRDRDGSVAYYLSEKIVSDDAKGVGPFMMAYAQKLLVSK